MISSMKHLKHLLLLSILYSLVLFTNCGDDKTCATCSSTFSNQLDAFGDTTNLTSEAIYCIADGHEYDDLQMKVDNGKCTWN